MTITEKLKLMENLTKKNDENVRAFLAGKQQGRNDE